MTYLDSLSILYIHKSCQAFLNLRKRPGTSEACKALWEQFKMAALDEQDVPVLFMLAEEKIQTNVKFGSDINDLLEIAGNVFKVSTSSLTLQSYDNEWEEWVNLSSSFTATTRIKLKVVCKFQLSNKSSLSTDSKNCGFKQVTLKASADTGILMLNKDEIAREVQPYEMYLCPNPHTERLQFYNNVTPVLYNESFKDFSLMERFQNYLITERRFRFETESKINSITEKVADITTNSTNQSNGTAYNIQRLQKVPLDVSSNDVSRGERALSALQSMTNTCEDLSNALSEKKKTCYLPSMDLMPGGKSTLEYIQSKLDAVNQLKSTLFSLLDKVNGVVHELHRRYSRQTSAKADVQRQKRRKKEQRRKNNNKKIKVRGRQVNEVCELLTGKKMTIDVTQKATEAVINAGNLNREALNNKLRKRFHLEPLKDIMKQGYVSECALPEVEEAIKKLEAPVKAAKPLKSAKGKQMTLSGFLSAANTQSAETGESDSESSTNDSDCDSDSDQENDHDDH